MSSARFTKSDLARYPFLKENTEYIKTLNLKIEDMTSPELSSILERAEEKLNALVQNLLFDLFRHSVQWETAAAAFSPTRRPARKRAGVKASIVVGVFPVAISSARNLPAAGAALNP